MSISLTFPAPAKLNLFLHVIGRRPDGYHLLQSLMTFLDFNDEITLTLREDGEVRRIGEYSHVVAEQDLVVKAAKLLQKIFDCPLGVDISYIKRIPSGGGLGGGSSDAATVLMGLNKIWNLAANRQKLAEIGLILGADIPFFIGGASALVEGIGEKLTEYPVPSRWYLVLHPGIGISTAEVFSDTQLTRDSQPFKILDFSGEFGRNDLLPVVVRRLPEVGRLLDWLSQWGKARMSGSGTCCFVSFDTQDQALNAWSQRPKHYSGFIARSLDQHPLRDNC